MSKKRNPPSSKPAPKSVRTAANKSSRGLSDRTIALLLALFGFILYANTLRHGYVLDDPLAIGTNEHVQKGLGGILDLFTQPYREQCFGGCLYRPLTSTTFALEWMLAPNSPFIGHLMNVLWYAASGALLFFTLRKLMPERNTLFPLIAGILFIAHPIHTEVVANIKSRDEILSLFFVLLSLHQFSIWHTTKQWKFMLFAGLAFLGALLSKEGAITALVVFPFIGWIFFQKSFGSSVKSSLWAILPVGLFFLLRGAALSGLTAPAIHMFDNPILEAHGMERWGTAFLILLKYFLLLLFPLKLISDYSYNAVPLQSLGSITSMLGLLLYSAIGVYAVIGLIKRRTSGFFATAFLVSISLYSQLVIIIGAFMGERLLYLPSLWFILGATTLLTAFSKEEGKAFSLLSNGKQTASIHRGILVGMAGITLWFSIHTIIRNKDWVSDYTLMKADVEKSPNSIRLNDGYAEEIYKSVGQGTLTPQELKRRLDLSESHSQKSISIKPGISSYTNIANINMVRKDYPEALVYYKKIKEISTDQGIADRNIAAMLVYWAKEESDQNNNPTHALDLLNQALEYNAGDGETWLGIGINNYRLGKVTEAQTALEKAYSLAPASAAIKSNLVNLYLSLGMNDKAAALQE